MLARQGVGRTSRHVGFGSLRWTDTFDSPYDFQSIWLVESDDSTEVFSTGPVPISGDYIAAAKWVPVYTVELGCEPESSWLFPNKTSPCPAPDAVPWTHR